MPSLSSGIDLIHKLFLKSRHSRRRSASRNLTPPVALESRLLLTPQVGSFSGNWSTNALFGVTLHLTLKGNNKVKGNSEVIANSGVEILPAHPKFKGEVIGGNHLTGTILGKFRPIDRSAPPVKFHLDFDVGLSNSDHFMGTATYVENGFSGSPQSIVGTKIP